MIQPSTDEPERRRRNRRKRTHREAAPPKPRLSWAERRKVVAVRSRAAWLVLRRPLGIVASALVLFAVASGAVAVGRLVERYVRTAEAFRTTRIEVDGTARVSRQEVLDAAGLVVGRNVFDVGPDEARLRIEALPWVARAEVRRRLPGSYFIRVEERRPVAILVVDRPYLVSDAAVAFKPLEVGDPAGFPVVRGIETLDPADRRAVLATAVGLVAEYESHGLATHEPLREIHVDAGHGFELFVGDEPTEVRLGPSPFGQKLIRFRTVLDRLRKRGANPEYVVLDAARRENRVAVRAR